MNAILDMTLTELSAHMDEGKISSVDATKACLDRIGKTAALNNFLTVCESEALSYAKEADARRKNGEKGVLLGVPVAVKDNISTLGIKTTCASEFLNNYIPPFDAFVVKQLKKAGAVIVGKTNMDEFAMGCTNEHSAFGAVHNVHDTSRVSGGSSGGSANCVAAKQVFASLGSDTGGSIREPASYCGVVGFKPTYSAVSRNGLIAFASSLDQIGPIARTCADALQVLKVISAHDGCDSTSVGLDNLPVNLDGSLKGKKIGVAKQFMSGADSDVLREYKRAIKTVEDMGGEIVEVSIQSFDAALAVYYVLSSAEAASNLSRYDGVKYGRRADGYKDINELYVKSRTQFFGDEVKRRIMIGNYVLSSGYYDAYYVRAAKTRTLIKDEYLRALDVCDALLCPTAPTAAPKIGEEAKPDKTYYSDIYTVPVNIAGLPAVSVPFGKASDGMPIGMQVIGRPYADGDILAIGDCLCNGGGAKC
ncbi:MAG: Asp-tRNA(Asn)/Glu-tRNA(Gln) amidotransferase subunit GatA [Clostridiales bacterium]|nr:Asp-tRNA(Asn)/Glu-tRNA(Gln) amidotransferase subunit GatA [Clostridiales bacterium]